MGELSKVPGERHLLPVGEVLALEDEHPVGVPSVLDLPEDEKLYGQTYLCVSLKNFETANQIAEVLRLQNETQVYASTLPSVATDESIAKLAREDNTPIPDAPADITFESKGGMAFRFIAKNKRWSEPEHKKDEGKDFWKDSGLNVGIEPGIPKKAGDLDTDGAQEPAGLIKVLGEDMGVIPRRSGLADPHTGPNPPADIGAAIVAEIDAPAPPHQQPNSLIVAARVNSHKRRLFYHPPTAGRG